MARAKTAVRTECKETVVSKAVENHTHTCTGNHDKGDDHFCGVCRRYWWIKKVKQ